MAKKKMASKKKTLVTKKKPSSKRKRILSKTKKAARKKKASAIPKGYQSITPYLITLNASGAIDFYKKVFSAKEIMRMSRSDGKIAHAELKIGDSKIMLADEYPEMDVFAPSKYQGSPVGIHLYIKNVDQVFSKAISAGAKLVMPVENMFYGDRSGTLEDPYGHRWTISTHVEDVSQAQMKKRAAEIFK